MDNNNFCLGIDFGTTNSCLSIWYNNKAHIVSDCNGSNIIPTVIEISDDRKIIGNEAYIRKEIFKNTGDNKKIIFLIYEIKKLLGKKYSDLDNNIINMLSYNIITDDLDNIMIHDKETNKSYHIEEITIHLFMSFKTISEQYFSKLFNKDIIINDSVISVPAYFNKIQRELIKNSAINAGFNVLRLINEPTAAALSYGLGKNITNDSGLNIIVYDFGGGTLDVSLLNINDGVYEVLGSCGNNNLGGSDFDLKIIDYCIKKFIEINDIDYEILIININENNLQKLKYLSEQTKIFLSDNKTTRIKIENFYDNLNLDIKIDREIFNNITQDLLNIILKPIIDVLECCELSKKSIDEIILVGGMTRIPIIRHNIEKYFNKDVNCSINPDNVVSIGAAIHGYMIMNNKNIEDRLLLIDRLALSIGVETSGDLMDIIIPRGTIIPTKKTKKYTTDTDYIDSINIKIYEGERKFTKDNFLIGDFTLTGIEKQKRGIPEIQITFEIDSDGIIKIKAEDLDNPLNKRIIQISGNKQNLTAEQIDKIIANAKIMDQCDRVDKMKKESYLSLIDSSKKILENIESEDLKLNINIKIHISENINEILIWLESTSYDKIDIDKYKELLHDYKMNYSIYLLKNNSPFQELTSPEDDDIDLKNIHDDTIDNKRYIKEIKYIRAINDEYTEINNKIKIIKHIKKTTLDKEELDKILTNIDYLFNKTYQLSNDLMIKLFIDKNLNDEIVVNLCKDLSMYDNEFKVEFEKFNNEFNIINKLFNKIKEKENDLLNQLDVTKDEIEINYIESKLDIILEFESYIYKINNGYITVENKKILEILHILDKWKY